MAQQDSTMTRVADASEEAFQSAAIHSYVEQLVLKVLSTSEHTEGRPHVVETNSAPGICEEAQSARNREMDCIEHAEPSACFEMDAQDLDDDLDADDLVVFEESSFSSEDEAVPLSTAKLAHRRLPFIDQVHVRMANTMCVVRSGMCKLGDQLEALSYHLDDAAEKCLPQVEHLEDVVKVKIDKFSSQTQATYSALDYKASQYKRRFGDGADLVTEKAKAISQAAAVLRAKTEKIAASDNVQKRLRSVRSKLKPTNVRKSFHTVKERISGQPSLVVPSLVLLSAWRTVSR
jgi:hypothetical protein